GPSALGVGGAGRCRGTVVPGPAGGRSWRRSRGQPHRLPPWPPGSRWPVEHARHARAAGCAPAVAGEPVSAQAVPVTLDHQLVALTAVGALARGVVDVAGVGVADAVVQGDPPGP